VSIIDDSPASPKSIVVIMLYLLTLSFFLGYCLISFWPGPPLVVSAIKPNEAHLGDAQSVTLIGSGFVKGLTVSFDAFPGTVDQVDGLAVTVKPPKDHPSGFSGVVVKNPTGQEVAIANGFLFDAANIKPNSGPTEEETPVTITGKGFVAGKVNVSFGKTVVADDAIKVQSDTELSVKAPKHIAGIVDVLVSDLSGQRLAQARFTYTDQTLGSAWPNEYRSSDVSNESDIPFLHLHLWVPEGVRTLLLMMIVGALGSLIHVFRSFYWYVGNRSLTNSWITMYIILPFNGAGLAVLFYLIIRGSLPVQAPINPTSLDGYAAIAALVGMFSQEAIAKLKQIAGAVFATAEAGKDQAIIPAAVTSITPASGPSSGGTEVTIIGSGFVNGLSVDFGGNPATNVSLVSSTKVTATTPSHPAGAVDIKISNPSGSSFTSAGSFNFVDPVANATTVTAISPESGPSAGGIPVTITGSGFVNGLSVAFGGSPASTVTVVNGTQVTAIAPAHPAGAINVTITDITGTSLTSPGQFTYI
jgi:hypothetical protein